MARLIEAYLDDLSSRLSFDPHLAERMREEIAGHVEDALDASEAPSEDDVRRVLTRLGSPRAMASHYLLDALDRQSERLWWALLTMMAATFLAMRLRTLGLAAPSDGGALLDGLIPLVDRYGLVAAMVIGAAGWLAARRLPAGETLDHETLRRPILVTVAAGLSFAALAASVVAGGARIWLQAPGDLPPALILGGLIAEITVLSLGGWLITLFLRRTLLARALVST
ncbi:hypothetical protein E8L99_10015 [Phreatobacter aquaticus]|uniref:Uncharacterized protein n=1 Tax=Phreatobacter aquaticus TaxID=2570229 RepID=A0A4D7QL07_9HYPH|nr:hypothetical protein [Phreatobacter aquaticus]QCK86064.1 hypothetical protein E8L99_10015 [Phreatobacter aquaticus]